LKKNLFDVPFILLTIVVSILGAIIGMQLITTLGVTPNTSVIGALVAMLLARVPLNIFQSLRSTHAQNTVQTSVSAATFGAANSLLIPIGIPYVMGRTDLIIPMLIGVSVALVIDGFIIYKVFDSKMFPSTAAWPPGVAAAETINAGDKGGKQAGFLGLGILGGLGGSFLGIPMSAAGIAFIANIWAMVAFGVGLLVTGYSNFLFGTDIDDLYIPHGIMVGAGLTALVQFVIIMIKDQRKIKEDKKLMDEEIASSETDSDNKLFTRSSGQVVRMFGLGYVLYALGAILLASVGGILTDLSIGMIILFVLFAAFTALATEVIVGVAAMHSGWFPAFAVSLISLIVCMLFGFPPVALALLVGYTAATGPAFADLGYDLKAGYIVRGEKENLAFEIQGRKDQFKSTLIGFGVAIILVSLFHNNYFSLDLIPPIDEVYVSTIEAGISSQVAFYLVIWAIPGAIVQIIGGPGRQLGVLFATGLLVADPIAGLTVLVGVLVRSIIYKWKGKEAETNMFTVAAGFIAGDALYEFFSSVWKSAK